MKSKRIEFPLVKLPAEVQSTLFLIREELKSRRLFHALHDAGFDDCYFQPHLDALILKSVGMDDDSDETFDAYYNIIEKRSRKIEADNDSITRQAFKVYMELLAAKEKRVVGRN